MRVMHIQGFNNSTNQYQVGDRLFKTLACARYHAQITNQSIVQIPTQTKLDRDIQWRKR